MESAVPVRAPESGLDRHGSRTAGPHPSDGGLLIAELADLDDLLRERDGAWRELVRHLDALRREIVVTGAQAQRSRSLAARAASRDGDAGARPAAPTGDEVRTTRLTKEFEASLRETEERRVRLHAEMDDLRRRRQALVPRLPVPVSRAYLSLVLAGRLPAIAAVAKGVCGGCEAPLSESVSEALRRGAVTVCARCERLLRPPVDGA
jgi:predicted  nucleic acid-binding Zn-ribbon protein